MNLQMMSQTAKSKDQSLRERAKQRLNGRRLVFSLNYGQASREDWDAYNRIAELASQAGGTHVNLSLPFLHGSWVLPDSEDPYAAWSATSPTFLRVFTPEALYEWVSPDHANWCQEYLQKQIDILRKHDLKATVHMVEPHWLPEEVYRAHPRWRGAQCELGRIATRPYFAPSIDEPEVLELYRQAVTSMVKRFPEIEFVQLLSNDSGGGIAWTPCIYPGMNGPVAYRTRDGGERISSFLNTLRDASLKAGGDLNIDMYSSGFTQELRASTRAKLIPGAYLSNMGADGQGLGGPGASLSGALWHPSYPIVGLNNPDAFLKGAQSVYSNPTGDTRFCSIGMHASDFEMGARLLNSVIDEPRTGTLAKAGQLFEAATWFAGSEDGAETVISAWEQINKAVHALMQVRQKGFGLIANYAVVSMRWLERPLVPEPYKLTEEESAAYRPFVYASGKAKADPRFNIVLGKSVFNGESVMWMTRWCLQEAMDTLRGAASQLTAKAKAVGESKEDQAAAGADRLNLLAARCRALACLAANVKHCVMYQYSLDIADFEQYGPNPMDYDDNMIYDQRALTLRKIAREELDNITQLIELIDTHGRELIDFAPGASGESVFRFGPNLQANLKTKMDIMLNHWQDYERLYPATRIEDFEPWHDRGQSSCEQPSSD